MPDVENTGQANVYISRVLLVGSGLGAGVVALGLLWFLLQPGNGNTLPAAPVTPFAQLADQLVHVGPLTVINLGLLLLMVTPILRVIIAVISFFLERDRKYTLISLVVLVILLFSVRTALA